ncbi:MAG: indolepyruvate ferredoxin oxidoreductase subunit alpha [Bacteroidales bacterium]|nr:indolepyruvate ferredoxin oxidoreductase subunit alpha [Bacteroidales bacterium]MCF8403215.1 indolepyruvate ferredoxin oxidoreductase subunit alpha [Bacteroidales bacterium]
MEKVLLLGDEAIAQGAIDAGISGIYAYPGTPSTEIMEYVITSDEAQKNNIRSGWASNEKTAMEASLGMSYVGKRSIVCMKHVGLNVAADAFINSAITGANGGLIVVVADDPSMHSSQNEQDSRFFGQFAMIPVLEPSNQQEAYDMMHYGFDLSEKFGIPVLMRITTRLAHSRSGVVKKTRRKQNEISLPKTANQFILLPSNARKRFRLLLDNQPGFLKDSESSPFNKLYQGKDSSLGIIASGIAYNYLMENFSDRDIPYPVLKVGQYPLPKHQVSDLYEQCDEILILEDGYPMIEETINSYFGLGKKIKGRIEGTLQRDGELNPNKVASALGFVLEETLEMPGLVAPRPPKLCKGCPHIYSYNALNDALAPYTKGRVFSDIGCYTLGALEPFEAINTCVDMGASITMAKGAADAGFVPAISVIGDSTFTHSGMTGLLDAVNDNSPITVIILDNGTVAMTGGQKSQATGKIEKICEAIGVEKDHIVVMDPSPKWHEKNLEAFKKEIDYQGVSVIIPRRECLHTATQKIRDEKKKKELENIQN